MGVFLVLQVLQVYTDRSSFNGNKVDIWIDNTEFLIRARKEKIGNQMRGHIVLAFFGGRYNTARA